MKNWHIFIALTFIIGLAAAIIHSYCGLSPIAAWLYLCSAVCFFISAVVD